MVLSVIMLKEVQSPIKYAKLLKHHSYIYIYVNNRVYIIISEG